VHSIHCLVKRAPGSVGVAGTWGLYDAKRWILLEPRLADLKVLKCLMSISVESEATQETTDGEIGHRDNCVGMFLTQHPLPHL